MTQIVHLVQPEPYLVAYFAGIEITSGVIGYPDTPAIGPVKRMLEVLCPKIKHG